MSIGAATAEAAFRTAAQKPPAIVISRYRHKPERFVFIISSSMAENITKLRLESPGGPTVQYIRQIVPFNK